MEQLRPYATNALLCRGAVLAGAAGQQRKARTVPAPAPAAVMMAMSAAAQTTAQAEHGRRWPMSAAVVVVVE
jgi:hypothetical protein